MDVGFGLWPVGCRCVGVQHFRDLSLKWFLVMVCIYETKEGEGMRYAERSCEEGRLILKRTSHLCK